MYASRGVHTLPVDLTQLWVGATVSTALFGLLGVALGALTRNTVTAIVGGIAWAMVIEIGILSSVAPEIGKWLPAGNALALTSVGSAGSRCSHRGSRQWCSPDGRSASRRSRPG